MEPHNWEELTGAVVDGRFRLRTLTYAQRDQAEWIAQDDTEPDRGPVALTLIAPPPGEADQVRSKMLEAVALQHGRLLRLLGAGDARIPGVHALYLASESADETLVDRLRRGSLSDIETRRLVADVIAGLQYLHGRGLACRALEPQSVVRVGGVWKLADYARLHPIGVPDPGAAAESHGSRYVPPEAYDGRVLAASDVWSLAVLITEALAGTTAPVMLPEPFDTVCRACFEKDPDRRPTLQMIAVELAPPQPVVLRPVPQGTEPAAPKAAPQLPQRAIPEPVQPSAPRPAPSLAAVAGSARAMLAGLRVPPQVAQFARSRSFLIAAVALAALIAFWTRRGPVAEAPAAGKNAAGVAQPAPVSKPAAPAPMVQPAAKHSNGITGRADFAASDMQGHRTASGERFNNNSLTAAHPKYRMGTRVRVTNLANGRSVVVRINDRGRLRRGYIIRLTKAAARELRFGRSGSARVRVEVVDTAD